MRSKKKGSTLVTVVIIFGILFTVGTAILALTASDFKMRVVESKRVQNLYSSESGLDITEGIIRKAVEVAIIKGNTDVNTFTTSLYGDTGILKTEKDKQLSGQTCTYPKSGDDKKSRLLDDKGEPDNNAIITEQNNIFKSKYKNFLQD